MDVDSLWTSVLGEIELEISRANFASFFKGVRISKNDNGVFELICPNSASQLMLQNRFYLLIKSHVEKRLHKEVAIRFTIAPAPTPSPKDAPLFSLTSSFEETIRKTGLNPNFTFDTFAVSESNQMAFAAAQAVAGKPGKAYNPLFLWGSTGVGKTHLMQALGHQALTQNPSLSIIYCTGEEFTNEIIEAIRERSTSQFKKKYRKVRLLLVDDIQFIAGRESVQMEFFHTFNSILQVAGQVVLTSDKPPTDIDKLEARLRSRFEGGLIVDITPPNFELRTAILLIKAADRGISLPMDIAKTLAANFEDARALEGALLRFLSEREHENDPTKILSKLLNQRVSLTSSDKKSYDPLKAMEIVASHFDLKVTQLTGTSRKRQLAEPRQLLMYVFRQEMGLPFEEIGALIGGRDHSTIIHGVDKITALLPKKDIVRNHLTQIRRLLWG